MIEVTLIAHDLGREETYEAIRSSLCSLQRATDTVFGRIEERIDKEQARLDELSKQFSVVWEALNDAAEEGEGEALKSYALPKLPKAGLAQKHRALFPAREPEQVDGGGRRLDVATCTLPTAAGARVSSAAAAQPGMPARQCMDLFRFLLEMTQDHEPHPISPAADLQAVFPARPPRLRFSMSDMMQGLEEAYSRGRGGMEERRPGRAAPQSEASSTATTATQMTHQTSMSLRSYRGRFSAAGRLRQKAAGASSKAEPEKPAKNWPTRRQLPIQERPLLAELETEGNTFARIAARLAAAGSGDAAVPHPRSRDAGAPAQRAEAGPSARKLPDASAPAMAEETLKDPSSCTGQCRPPEDDIPP